MLLAKQKMGKNKLERFAQNKTFSNVLEPQGLDSDFRWKGTWAKSFFGNDHPITLELGCGKGEYTLALARKNPHRNFIGLDIKGARLWRGAKQALDENLTNVAFLRTRIEWLENFFAPYEIQEIWITFADPQIKYKRAKHRLTHPLFLDRYSRILHPSGLIHLKTDSEFLYGYTEGILGAFGYPIHFASPDVYHPDRLDLPSEVRENQTFYEKKFLIENKKITYLQFSLVNLEKTNR